MRERLRQVDTGQAYGRLSLRPAARAGFAGDGPARRHRTSDAGGHPALPRRIGQHDEQLAWLDAEGDSDHVVPDEVAETEIIAFAVQPCTVDG